MFEAGNQESQAENLHAAAPPVDAADIASRIRQLDAFRAAGVVDDAEYAEQKARILAAL
jgi:hypothetical protein